MEYFVYMTNNCNLNCKYCSVLLDCEKNNLPIKPIYQFEQLVNFIKTTQDNLIDNEVSIYFFGGEPSLEYDDIIDFIKIAKLELSRYDLKFVLHTNGLLLNKLPQSILDELSLILFSINYEQIPHHALYPGYFSTVIDNAIDIKARKDIPIIARLTVTEETSIFTELVQVCNFFDYVYWQIENCSEFKSRDKFVNTYIYEINRTFDYWLKYLREGVMLKYVPFMAALKFIFFHDRDDNKFSCGYSHSMVYVQTDGKCYSCSDNVEGGSHYIGNIYDGVKLQNYKLQEFRCRNCNYRSICMGRCGRMHIDFTNDHITDYCIMNQSMFDLFLDNKEVLKNILDTYPKYRNELEHWILEYTEFTP